MRRSWRMMLALGLIMLSVFAYSAHYLIFHDAHHLFIYLAGDIAFVPLEVLLVTFIIHELLDRREKQALLTKLNMVIGAFFSELGTTLLRQLATLNVSETLRPTIEWDASDYSRSTKHAMVSAENMDANLGDLLLLKNLLHERRDLMLRLLENPNLLEHESFTDLLWAVFHLAEELANRQNTESLPSGDLAHLSGDIQRAYRTLAVEWLAYMQHLQKEYPYLFSLAVRTNPFDPHARPEVV